VPKNVAAHESVRLNPPIIASIHCETPIHFLDDSRLVPPKPHHGGADGPIVLEPSGTVCHSSVDIPESRQNLDAAAFQPRLHLSAGAGEALAPQLAPASSALSAPPTMQYI